MPQFGGKQPQGAFYDTDFGTIDDLLAVSVLYGLQGKGDCRVAILTMSRPNLAVAGFADAVQRFYHGAAANFAQLPPIGMRTGGSAGETSPAFTAPFEKKKLDGTPAYKNEVRSAIDTGDPHTLIRNYLDAQHDHDAVFVLSGPATNLAEILAFRGMKERIAAKIKFLTVAGGAFPEGPADPHIAADVASARKLFAEWPTPIVACGAEIGKVLAFPGASIDKEFAAAAPENPVADAYRAYRAMPYDTRAWAMAAALYTARPDAGYFKLSDTGTIGVDPQGRTSFAPSNGGPHRYLIADPAQKDKIVQQIVELASAKPPEGRRRPPVQQDATPVPAGKPNTAPSGTIKQ